MTLTLGKKYWTVKPTSEDANYEGDCSPPTKPWEGLLRLHG